MPIYKKVQAGIVKLTKILSVFNPQYKPNVSINTSLTVKIL